MGYRSDVYLKTTTEGWLMIKKLNDSIPEFNEQPLAYSEVSVSSDGNYKIEWTDIKWYDSFKSVQHVNNLLEKFDEQDIPYSFIRFGEDVADVEHRRNYPDDIPWTIECFEPVVDVNDEERYEKYETYYYDPAKVKSEHPDMKGGE